MNKWIWGFFDKPVLNAIRASIVLKRERPRFKTLPKENGKKEVEYFFSDPGVLDLKKTIIYPDPLPSPNFTVYDFAGGGFPFNSLENTAASVYTTIHKTLSFVNKFSYKKINNWSKTNNLLIYPNAGNNFNASYDRATVKLYSATSLSGEVIFTANSADIVSHELSHAILDSYRPELYNLASLETIAFHEAFADITSMLTILDNSEVIDYVIKTTNGNLMKSNCVSQIAEQLGITLFEITKSSERLNYCLRDAINNFKYEPPGNLPTNSDNYYKLSSNPHDFGKILVGACYEILVLIYMENIKNKMTYEEALIKAKEEFSSLFFLATLKSPMAPQFFDSFAKTFLSNMKTNSQIVNATKEIFENRNILQPVTLLSTEVIKNKNPILNMTQVIKLSDYYSAQSIKFDLGELYDLKVEVPLSSMPVLGENNEIIEYRKISESSLIQCAFEMMNFVKENNSLNKDFFVENGFLKRKFFMACLTKTPNDPEWGKLYKPQNNKGCCGGCCNKNSKKEASKLKILKNCSIRYKI